MYYLSFLDPEAQAALNLCGAGWPETMFKKFTMLPQARWRRRECTAPAAEEPFTPRRRRASPDSKGFNPSPPRTC